jgi:hypothetical protein
MIWRRPFLNMALSSQQVFSSRLVDTLTGKSYSWFTYPVTRRTAARCYPSIFHVPTLQLTVNPYQSSTSISVAATGMAYSGLFSVSGNPLRGCPCVACL